MQGFWCVNVSWKQNEVRGNDPQMSKMAAINNMQTLHIWDTVYSADCVEWCPVVPYQNVFVCGTYQLAQSQNAEVKKLDSDCFLTDQEKSEENAVSDPCSRLGRLYLFSIDSSRGLCLLQTLEMPAILDCKWCHCKIYGKILLAIANSVGDVLIYEMRAREAEADENNIKNVESEPWLSCNLSLVCNCVIAQDVNSETLALSLDWSTGCWKFKDAEENVLISVSDSKGCISVLRLNHLALEKTECWKAHGFEAWITAFDYWNSSVIYTGGDDCRFQVYDLRTGTQHPISSSRAHEAGVTSLHSNALFENLLASGSYDENIRIWDTRCVKHPVSSTPLGGGVWRLKWDPHRWQHLLAACMHGGFYVLDYADKTKPPFVVATYREHQSLAYGSDWCHLMGEDAMNHVKDQIVPTNRPAEDLRLVATCSFYDHKLCVSALK